MTLGLALITNSGPEAKRIVKDYAPYFDKLYITVADKDEKLFTALQKQFAKNSKVDLSYFQWIDHFGKARLYNRSRIKTDYWMWIDSDDTIEGVEHVRTATEYMDKQGLDTMAFVYDYGQSTSSWRERIIRNNLTFTWTDIPCHEGILAIGARRGRGSTVSVRHHKTEGQAVETIARNQRLLEKDWAVRKSSQTAFHLGKTYLFQKEYGRAIEMFRFMLNNKEAILEEQRILIWQYVAVCYNALKKFDEAIASANMAVDLDPSYPDPWYIKAIIYADKNEYEKAKQFAEIAMSRKPSDKALMIYDQTSFKYRGIFAAARAYLFTGNAARAFELYRQVIDNAPYVVEDQNWNRIFEEAYRDSEAIEHVRQLADYMQKNGADTQELFLSLPRRLQDNRISLSNK